MRLTDLRFESSDDRHVLRAVAEYEDSDRGRHELFVETPTDGPWTPRVQIEAFFPVVAMAAHAHRERRLFVDEPIDPGLRWGVTDAMAQIDAWRGEPHHPVAIEADGRTLPASSDPHTVLLLTGGVDSTATLIENHQRFEPGNPRRITTGIVHFPAGFSYDHATLEVPKFAAAVAERHGLDVVVVRSNGRVLDPRVRFWWDHAQTATWSAMVHVFSDHISRVVIGVDEAIGHPDQLHGSDPALDPFFESSHLQLWHGIRRPPREERVAMVAADGGLPTLQVCNRPPDDWRPLNCGECEKCLRTMTQIESIGRLGEAAGFPDTLTPARLRAVTAHDWATVLYYLRLVPALEARGRHDLVVAIQAMARRHRKVQLRGLVREADRRILGGRIRRRLGRGSGR